MRGSPRLERKPFRKLRVFHGSSLGTRVRAAWRPDADHSASRWRAIRHPGTGEEYTLDDRRGIIPGACKRDETLLSRLILLFVAVPLVELAILLQVAQVIGLMPTIALVVTTGVAGAALARHQGLRAFLAVQQELASGRLPGRSLLDGLSFSSARLPIDAGILTDIAGFSLLVPLSRRWLQGVVKRAAERRIRKGRSSSGYSLPAARPHPRRGEVGTHPPNQRRSMSQDISFPGTPSSTRPARRGSRPGRPASGAAKRNRFARVCGGRGRGKQLTPPSGADARPLVLLARATSTRSGLQVTHADESGLLYFAGIGGWDAQVLVGQRVRVLGAAGDVPGVIGRKAIHLMEPKERTQAVKVKKLWIDVGAASLDELKEMGVRVGDPAVIDAGMVRLAGDRVASRAIDNRVGAFVRARGAPPAG